MSIWRAFFMSLIFQTDLCNPEHIVLALLSSLLVESALNDS